MSQQPKKPQRNPKTPGSRRWNAERKHFGHPEWWHEGLPKGQEHVAIRFTCRDHPKQTLGFFYLETFDGANPPELLSSMGVGTLKNGVQPLAPAAVRDQVRLVCDAQDCRVDVPFTPERVHRGLLLLWAPHARRVKTVQVP